MAPCSCLQHVGTVALLKACQHVWYLSIYCDNMFGVVSCRTDAVADHSAHRSTVHGRMAEGSAINNMCANVMAVPECVLR